MWVSLARDYLTIMATSVSSERTFSSAGIIITKHRNRLKGDIVEALQVLKSAFHKSLFFLDCGPTSVTKTEPEEHNENSESKTTGGVAGPGQGDTDDEFKLIVELDTDAEDNL